MPSPAIQSVRFTASWSRECVPIKIGVIDVGIVQIAVRLHLGLDCLHDLALAQLLVIHLDAGDLLEGLGEDLGFVVVRAKRTF